MRRRRVDPRSGFTVRHSRTRDWNHEAPPMTPEQHFQARSKQWLLMHA